MRRADVFLSGSNRRAIIREFKASHEHGWERSVKCENPGEKGSYELSLPVKRFPAEDFPSGKAGSVSSSQPVIQASTDGRGKLAGEEHRPAYDHNPSRNRIRAHWTHTARPGFMEIRGRLTDRQ